MEIIEKTNVISKAISGMRKAAAELGNFQDQLAVDLSEVYVKYDKVKISITDHEKGGVSDKCHKLVKSIDDMGNEELTEYARTLKNARQQGVGLRFPKSAIKANPARFRPYNR